MLIKESEFTGSYPNISKMPAASHPEFAFIGRSNVGKSSLINMLTNKKGLAKTSSKPGKTQHIVHFLIDKKWFLTDLPGYGYAKVSKEKKATFSKLIEQYLLKRESLFCVFVLIDGRLDPQPIDLSFIEWLGVEQIPFVIVFTKSDKIKKSELEKNVKAMETVLLKQWDELPQVFISSAENGDGKEAILHFIEKTLKASSQN